MKIERKPEIIPVIESAIPKELRTIPHWVVWRLERKNGKDTKPPYQTNGLHASHSDPSTWTTFDNALEGYHVNGYAGVGFVLSKDDKILGIDLDSCREPDTGEIEQWAWVKIEKINSYTEISPTGTGVRIICRGTLPCGGRKRNKIETYDNKRYLTITGQHIDGTPITIESRDKEIAEIHAEVFPENNGSAKDQNIGPNHISLEDDKILTMAKNASNGDKFVRLWNGDYTGYPSQSEADLALCSLLSFWTKGDSNRIDRLFRKSGLFRPKWDEKHYGNGQTYGQATVEKALNKPREICSPQQTALEPIRENYVSMAESKGRSKEKNKLLRIDVSDQDLDRLTKKTWAALRIANENPTMFRYGDSPNRIEKGDDGTLFFRVVNRNRMRHFLAQNLIIRKKNKPAHPPMALVDNMLATPDIPLPVLNRIVETPIFADDGTLQLKPGYQEKSKTFYVSSKELALPNISPAPSSGDLSKAKELIIDDLLGDFPFAGEPDLAHAIALYLLPFCREMIHGPTPLHLLEKPSAGTGASLLVDVLTSVSIGHPLAVMTEARDEEEWRKRITAKLRGGPSFVFIDNLRNRLQSSSLSAAITATYWEDRILSKSEDIRIPIRCIWIATGNNPAVSSEIARRTIQIRLDAKQDRPWLRENFKYPNLRVWVKKHRSHLVFAALTLTQKWISEGRPIPDNLPTLGNFESWTEVIGGILHVADIPGFLGNITEFYEKSDAEGDAWRGFVAAWWGEYNDQPVGVSELWRVNAKLDEPLDLGKGSERSEKVKLGLLLKSVRDRYFDDLCVSYAGEVKRANKWKLLPRK
jgi:hypothetical protein